MLLTRDMVSDQYYPSRDEIEYVFYDDCLDEDEMAVIAKPGYNQGAVIITVYKLRVSDYE
jgi:hypothetical protein